LSKAAGAAAKAAGTAARHAAAAKAISRLDV
jgi:hypothetical protein